MTEVIRPDLFRIDPSHTVSPGFKILRVKHGPRKQTFLNQLSVAPTIESLSEPNRPRGDYEVAVSEKLFESIEDGDIAIVSERGTIRVLLSRKANQNTLLVTEQCDNRCSFCSQPPKDNDDSWLLINAAMAVADFGLNGTIGITGGEPLLYGDAFVNFLDFVAEHTPQTELHILSNGRAFSNLEFAKRIAGRNPPQMTFGIPLYAAIPQIHDELVGARGAFSETFAGLINAGNLGIPIELRIIPTSKNIQEIAHIVELVNRCLSSVAQISIMNLEPAGWAKKNWSQLYEDPMVYKDALLAALSFSSGSGPNIALFNYPLCHLPEELRSYAVKSISDWKNFYPEECNECSLQDSCTGFFSSSQGKFHQSPRRII